MRITYRAVTLAAIAASVIASGAVASAAPAGSASGGGPVTSITINGEGRGALFGGVGSISGGASNTRLLIDYPPAQRNQILNYLFGPGGADLQMLKLEIGGDASYRDGAETSVEHSRGVLDCQSGYGWWLAEQAVARNPNIILMGLQWSAPGWIGSLIWDPADIGYVIDWLNCAKSHGLVISYLGGWDEHGYVKAWFEQLRSALDTNGFSSVKIIAADSFPGRRYIPARTWNVAVAAAADPKFKAALSVIGSHDTCGGPTQGYVCESTRVARDLGLPLWESELGSLKGTTAAANMARLINNGFIQAGVTGFLQWPLATSTPGLLQSDRGLVEADQPQSGWYQVHPITWAIAQTTQFVQPGWRHVPGASGTIGDSGNYVAYASPDRSDWSLVAENTGKFLGQRYGPQTIAVHLSGGLKTSHVSVWSTDLRSSDPRTWFVHRADVRVRNGSFTYPLPPGYIVSFTSTTGQSHRQQAQPPASVPMKLPYTATPDDSNEAWGMDTQEGAFLSAPCQDGATGQCIQQFAVGQPIFWHVPQFGIPVPDAVVGYSGWANYTVSANVLFPTAAGSAGLISRFADEGNDPKHFNGYQFDLTAGGKWQLLRNASEGAAQPLGSGTLPGIAPGTWHALSLEANGTTLTATVDGTTVAQITDPTFKTGLAGIESNWTSVQFNNVTVR